MDSLCENVEERISWSFTHNEMKVSTSPMEERFNTLPTNPMVDRMLQYLDPLCVELIKSYLGKPSCFDYEEFQRSLILKNTSTKVA